MDFSDIRVGVIGVGSMGMNHARVYSELADLVAVSDASSEKVNGVTERFGCEGYTDMERMLDEADIHAVSIATPTVHHTDAALRCIEAGLHVLIEKPIADTMENGEKILNAAASSDKVMAVGMVERHNPVVNFTKEVINKGIIGDTVTISSKRVSNYPARINDVGVITDLGVHDIDAIRYLADSEVTSVYALGGSRKAKGLIDHANILLDFENGIKGIMEVSWLTPMKLRQLKITGMEGYAEMDYIDQEIKVSQSSSGVFDHSNLWRIPLNYETKRMRVAREEPLKRELRDFLVAISKNGEPLVNAVDGLKDLEVAKAAEESIREHKMIDISK
jgi:UDP-N-acetylglucosamine 3-dehydrogenase